MNKITLAKVNRCLIHSLMAIKVSEVISLVRGLVAEPVEKFFKTPFLILAFNSAQEHAFTELMSISEFQWLTKSAITIDSAAVTAKTRSYALPDRTVYVSNYTTDRNSRIANRDFRPKFNNGSADTWLIELLDYSVSLPNLVLHYDPTETGTIEFWYKALPARISNETASVTFFPDFFFNYFVEYLTWYCQRREADELPQSQPRIQAELLKCRALLNNAGGRPTGFQANWDNVCDWDV